MNPEVKYLYSPFRMAVEFSVAETIEICNVIQIYLNAFAQLYGKESFDPIDVFKIATGSPKNDFRYFKKNIARLLKAPPQITEVNSVRGINGCPPITVDTYEFLLRKLNVLAKKFFYHYDYV